MTIFNSTPYSDTIWHHCGHGCGCTSPQHTFTRAVDVVRKFLLGRRFKILNTKEFAACGRSMCQQAFGDLNNHFLEKLVRVAMQPGAKQFRHECSCAAAPVAPAALVGSSAMSASGTSSTRNTSSANRRRVGPGFSFIGYERYYKAPDATSCTGIVQLGDVPLHSVEDASGAKQAAFVRNLEDVNWHELAGKRVKDLETHFLVSGASFRRCSLAMLFLAIETSNSWLEYQRPQSDKPKVCDLRWAPFSPRTAIHQLFSSMLSSASPCAISLMLFQHRGYNSFEQLALLAPREASWFRSIVTQADAAMWLWWGEYDSDDLLVAEVADDRRSDDERATAFNRFMESKELDPHCGERMRAHFKKHGFTALTVLLPEQN